LQLHTKRGRRDLKGKKRRQAKNVVMVSASLGEDTIIDSDSEVDVIIADKNRTNTANGAHHADKECMNAITTFFADTRRGMHYGCSRWF